MTPSKHPKRFGWLTNDRLIHGLQRTDALRVAVRGTVLLGALLVICLPSAAQAQVVQLPTIRSFGYIGSVSVPDSGTASLGGNVSSSQAWARRGWNRGIGGAGNVGNASASVTIIDHQAIDRKLRGLDGTTPALNRKLTAKQINEGKALVRYARKMREAGNDALARQAYEMSLKKLDPRLQRLAKAEYQRYYGKAGTISNSLR